MNTVVIGAQWGDEGKGKIVDYLAEKAELVIRYAGGANAGHTIVKDGERYALHLVPSGVLYPGKTVILGAGMVIDPAALFEEIAMLEERGVKTAGRILISDRAHLVLPGYRMMDRERDAARRHPIGTTGRGIGITYAQKCLRDGIRLADMDRQAALEEWSAEDREFLSGCKDRLQAMAVDIPAYLAEHKPRSILLEGAQGALLDLDLGTYPFVSSGMSCAAGAAIGGCIGPREIDSVLGVFKAYTSRVGNGPFPSEFREEDSQEAALCDFVRETGHEYGVTTGRARRCGYLDLVALRYACRTNSIDSLVMTHLDVYDSLEEIACCVAYTIEGKECRDFPASIDKLEAARPVLKRFAGWKTPIGAIRGYDALPREAKDYLTFIEDYCATKISMVSVGPDRAQTIVR
jgi:adenylosuccinate synthase